ncbi:MAG TPA: lipase family protein [Acidimicrobiia bacterium]
MREHGWARGTTLLVAAVLVVVGAPLAGATPSGSGASSPRRLRAGKPGELISATPVIAPAGSRAWKVLYHSRALDGRDIEVSGVVVAPTSKPPSGGRPVVTWAHGTHGLADMCAPSQAIDSTYRITGIHQFLKAGYVVAATDYEGLGTPGQHPYLVGESEGRGVLDIVRAAEQLPGADASATTLIYGHSQGGQAALFAGQIAPTYAPDLHVLGVTAVAPVSDLSDLLPEASAAAPLVGYLVMAAVGLHTTYPIDLSAILTPQTLANLDVVDRLCSDDLVDYYAQFAPSQVVLQNPVDVPGVASVLLDDRAGNVSTPTPLLVIQGDQDALVPKAETDAFVQRACALGDRVDYRIYPGEDHVGARDASVNDVAAWMADRVAGRPAPSTC